MLILGGLTLIELHSRNWAYVLALFGLILTQSGLTDRCPLRWLLEKAGLPRCAVPRPPESLPVPSR